MVTSRRRRRRRGRGRHGSQLSAGTCRSRWRLYRPALSDGTSAEPPLCLPLNVLYSLLMRRQRGCYDKRGNLYMLKRLSDRNRVFELSVVLFCLGVFFFFAVRSFLGQVPTGSADEYLQSAFQNRISRMWSMKAV